MAHRCDYGWVSIFPQWPTTHLITYPPPSIHERSAREKISADQVAHVLNDEVSRKYIQSLKRSGLQLVISVILILTRTPQVVDIFTDKISARRCHSAYGIVLSCTCYCTLYHQTCLFNCEPPLFPGSGVFNAKGVTSPEYHVPIGKSLS